MSQLEVYRIEPSSIDWHSRTGELVGEEAHHLIRVRRARPGDNLLVIDGEGTAWSAQVIQLERDRALLRLDNESRSFNEPGVHLHLGLGILKADHFGDAVNQAVQAGVNAITPLQTRYAVAGWSSSKQERSQRIALAAAKQCGRGLIPPVHAVQPLDAWCIQTGNCDHCLLLDADGGPVPDVQPGQSIALAVGPEGGFSSEEIAMMREVGFTPIRLGNRRLRSETAAALGVAVIVLPFENRTKQD